MANVAAAPRPGSRRARDGERRRGERRVAATPTQMLCEDLLRRRRGGAAACAADRPPRGLGRVSIGERRRAPPRNIHAAAAAVPRPVHGPSTSRGTSGRAETRARTQINVQGEEQKKLDLVANDVLKDALRYTGKVGLAASEEEADPMLVEEAYFRRAELPLTHRAAAAATWLYPWR